MNHLRQETAFCKKEVAILKSEQDTIADVAVAQQNDIERYLSKETNVLNDCIHKQSQRQKAEYSRFQDQLVECRQIRDELNGAKNTCVDKLSRVQDVLGVQR